MPSRETIRRAILAATLVLGTAVVLGLLHGKTSPPSAETSFIEGPPSLHWVQRGSQLLVNGKWLLNPGAGSFTALPYATARALQGGGLASLGMSLSWDGERIVLWDEHTFRFGPVSAVLGEPVAIPRLNPLPEEDAGEQEAPGQVLFWASEHQLLLYQFDKKSDAEPLCSLFDTRVRTWHPGAPCPWGDFTHITDITPGPDGWIAISSSAEGTATLRLAQYDLEQGQRDVRAPQYSLYPMGLIRAYFSLDGTRITLSTNCRFHEEQHPCEEQEDERWQLYSWLLKEEKLVLVSEGLPHPIVPTPGGERWAWLLSDRVCLSDAAALEHKRCFCMPRANSSACQPE